MLKGKRILVTGGAGFLGSHLCERLVAEDHRVFCLDNLQTGSLQNIAHLLHEPNFRFLRHDIVEPLEVPVDEIYNLGCPASPPLYQLDPVHTLKTSVYGAANLLELAVRHGSRILQASTSEVYGDPEEHPQTEAYWGNVNPDGIRACYDEGKRCAETLFFDYYRQHGVPIKVARIFNTYGPRMDPDDGRVVSNFVVQALQEQPLTVYGDGQQTRSFCSVDDLVDGLMGLMASPVEVTGPINLGNPYEVSMLDLAERILTMMGSRSRIRHQPLPEDDPVRRRPDISQARRLLHWQPKTNLNSGLRATVAYFRTQLELSGVGRRSSSVPVAEARLRSGHRTVAADESRATTLPLLFPKLPQSSG